MGQGATATRQGEFGAKTPWYRTRGCLGGGTSAATLGAVFEDG